MRAIAIFAAISMTGAAALAQTNSRGLEPVVDCDVTLFKHQETESVLRATHIFYLDLVTDENFTKMKQDHKGSWDGIYGFFKSDFRYLEEKRNRYRKEIQYNCDESFSRDFAVSRLTKTGLQAYKACLETKTPTNAVSLALLPETSVEKKVTFETIVRTTPGLSLAGVLTIEVDGGRLDTPSDSQEFRDAQVVVRATGDKTIITVGKPKEEIPPFTFRRTLQRGDAPTEFRAIPRYAGLKRHALIIPAKLETKIEMLTRRISARGRFAVFRDDHAGGRFYGSASCLSV